MTDISKAARGIVLLLSAATACSVYRYDQVVQAAARAHVEREEAAMQRRGRAHATGSVLWHMLQDGGCAPSVTEAAAIPCTKPWRQAAGPERVWTVGPAVKAVR